MYYAYKLISLEYLVTKFYRKIVKRETHKISHLSLIYVFNLKINGAIRFINATHYTSSKNGTAVSIRFTAKEYRLCRKYPTQLFHLHTFDFLWIRLSYYSVSFRFNLLESQLFTLTVPDNRHNVRIKGAWGEQLAVEENNSVLLDIRKDTWMRFFVTKRRFALEVEKLREIMT